MTDSPIWLALDSSSSTGSVAIGGSGGVVAEVSLDVRAGHSSALMPAVDYAVRSAGLEPHDLSAVIVGAGPGSFTGLRIAAATAKGIARGLDIPLFAYSSLLAVAAQAWSAAGPVCALFDARGRDVYAACYRFEPRLEVMLQPIAVSLDELIDRLRGERITYCVGDGAMRHAAELTEGLGCRVGPGHFTAPRAAALIWLRDVLGEAGGVVDLAGWQPEYLRASGAERIAAARARAAES